MKINFFKHNIFFLFFFVTAAGFAQDIGSETVVVVKPYSPSVNDAFKIKEVPSITDSVGMEKLQVQYSIFSVPVASTFSPAKGRPANVERQRPPKLYDNYFTLGFGNYTSVLAEFYSNIEVNRTDNFGIFLTHNSAQGEGEDALVDDHYYDSELNLNYTSRGRNTIWKTEFGAEHQLYNWYGLPSRNFSEADEINPAHNYFSVYAGGEINLDESFFDRAEAGYRYFGDDFNSSEHRFMIKPTLEIPIAGEIFSTNFILDYVGGSFDRNSFNQPINYGFLNVGLESGLVILRDDVTLDLGAAVYYSMDSEESDGAIYIYPQVTASYRMAGEYFIGYAGLEGELKQNSYYEFAQENPFVAPGLEIRPTDQQYKAYVGGKGKLSNSVGYNIRATYKAENDKPLFIGLPEPNNAARFAYEHGNSFQLVYDRVSTLSAFGELNFDVNRNFNLRLNGEFFVYDTENEQEAWNLPSYRTNVLADWQITDNWFAGANLFFVGQRKDAIMPGGFMPSEGPTVVELDPFADLNANLGYRFNDRLSIFARGHNLLGNNYERWLNYPVLGLQVMAGATYKFDWGRR